MPSSENASLQLRQRQEQRISPKQLQAITVLQMPVTDLADYIQQAILENPLLEYEPAENRHLDGFAQDRSFYAANTSVSPSELAGRIDPAINGLSLFLSEQNFLPRFFAAASISSPCLMTADICRQRTLTMQRNYLTGKC